MTKIRFLATVAVIIGMGLCVSLYLNAQESVDYEKLLGDWEMEVDAGGEYFTLFFTIDKTEDGFTGLISEYSGFFSDVALENIQFDGTRLIFEMTIPTPPDGYENLVKSDLEWIDGRFEGTLSVESLGISASATASKKS